MVNTYLIVVVLLCCTSVAFSQEEFNVTSYPNISTFTITQNTLNWSNVNDPNPGLQTPFQYNALSEVLQCTATYPGPSPYPIDAEYVIDSSKGLEFETERLQLTRDSFDFPVPTLGPCKTNGLIFHGQSIWSRLAFYPSMNGTNRINYTLSCTISRTYSNALAGMGNTYWIEFGAGHNCYYGAIVPIQPSNLGLTVTITRVNPALPPPSSLFTVLALATDSKCMNPGFPDENLPGEIEPFTPTLSANATLNAAFKTILIPNSMVYLNVVPSRNYSTSTMFHGYTISMNTVVLPPAPPVSPPHQPPPDAGTAFAIVCTVLIVLGACGLTYYFCVVRRRKDSSATQGEYSPITS